MAAMPGSCMPPQNGCGVHVESLTWSRERGDLFDFEAGAELEDEVSRQVFNAVDSVACMRSGNSVDLLPDDRVPYSISTGSELLVRLVRRAGSFWIDMGAEAAAGSIRPSLVVKELPGGGHWVRAGDTIRLGWTKMRVRQVVLTGTTPVRPRLRMDCEGPPCRANPEPMERLASKCCRICMLEGPSEDEPLIAPCDCKGSVEYVHVGCLREWLRVRRHLPAPNEPCASFEYRSLKCDLCRGPYASSILSETDSRPLAEVPSVLPPFVVLEVPGRHYGGGGRRMHVLSFAGEGTKVLKLGRAHNCHLSIPDASISRWHASLRLHKGKIILEDNNSRFGTLMEVQMPLLVQSSSVCLQVGRTVLRLSPADACLAGQPKVLEPAAVFRR